MKTSSLHLQSGMNLIEILVAALILSVGLLSLAGLQVASLKSVQNATQKQQASMMIHELLERMRSNREAAIAGNYNTSASCSATAPADCSGTTTCTPDQMAAYDIFTIQCGSLSAGTIEAGVKGQLLNGELTVACVDGGADCTTGVRVTLSWSERLAAQGIQESDGSGEAEIEDFIMSVDAVI